MIVSDNVKRIKKVGITIIVIGIILTISYFILQSTIPDVEVGEVSLANVSDGIYRGEYSAGLVRAVVKVEVKDGRMVQILIEEHDNGLGKPAENITEGIINNQSLNVDEISGATLSSNVIRKAVQVALMEQNNE